MAIFQCKMCGGELEVTAKTSVGVCQYCGTRQTLPRLDSEKKSNLYERANRFRRAGDFDKAAALYEMILSEDGADAEAYWSLVLCKYGVAYVEDPATHRRIPTCNRTQYTSIFADGDYQGALAHADDYQKEIYQTEAKAIDEIQQGILAISGKEDPFDVFICYKESDDWGRRTPDSVLATELYHELEQAGFRVFFARITLEDKLGSAYEPYIFAALGSAKVMVVIGTRPEYFQAVWVKNEWSRYLALIRDGAKKTLIPAYKDMRPEDLPEEFSPLQAQDMARLGFMQDLVHGIEKIAGSGDRETESAAGFPQPTVASLLRRMGMFLEDHDWERADAYADRILDLDLENEHAYVGKVMAALQLSEEKELANVQESLEEMPYYSRALRYASGPYQDQLQAYARQTADTARRMKLEAQYQQAVKQRRFAEQAIYLPEEKYQQAAQMFEALGDYQDAAEQAGACRAKAEKAAAKSHPAVRHSENTALHVRQQQARQRLEQEQIRQKQDARLAEKQRRKTESEFMDLEKLLTIGAIAFFVVIVMIFLFIQMTM